MPALASAAAPTALPTAPTATPTPPDGIAHRADSSSYCANGVTYSPDSSPHSTDGRSNRANGVTYLWNCFLLTIWKRSHIPIRSLAPVVLVTRWNNARQSRRLVRASSAAWAGRSLTAST